MNGSGVEPLVKTLEVFRRAGEAWALVRAFSGGVVGAGPFDAVEIDHAALWRSPAR